MTDHRENPVIIAKMQPRARREWTGLEDHRREQKKKQLRRKKIVFAAASLCIGTGVMISVSAQEKTDAVMSHISTGFEYDETIGRLQFVSNILPESAMVFLSSTNHEPDMLAPTQAGVVHHWSSSEPWLEYTSKGMISACLDGEIMTVVKNRNNEYTVRVKHDDGYESVYSGLSAIYFGEHEDIKQGQNIGMADGYAAFEIRKDGLSVMPVFSKEMRR